MAGRGSTTALKRRPTIVVACAVVAAVAAFLVRTPPAGAALPSHSSQATSCLTGTPSFTMRAPTIFGFDTTSGRDWGYVAWRPHVWKWTGAEWKLMASGKWVWSWAFDDTPAQYWYDFDGNYLGTTSSFAYTYSVPSGGYWYAVSDEFYWYASGSAQAASDHRWVTSYNGNAFRDGFCFF